MPPLFMHMVSTRNSTMMMTPPMPPPALVPPGIGIRIPPPPMPPPPPAELPTSRTRDLSSRALGLKRMSLS